VRLRVGSRPEMESADQGPGSPCGSAGPDRERKKKALGRFPLGSAPHHAGRHVTAEGHPRIVRAARLRWPRRSRGGRKEE